MNNVILQGRLTATPDLKFTQNGTARTTFTIAVDKQLSKEQREQFEKDGKPTADFINVVAWGGLGETISKYMDKGGRVCINGRIDTSSFPDKETGKMVYLTQVVAREIDIIDFKEQQQQNNRYRR